MKTMDTVELKRLLMENTQFKARADDDQVILEIDGDVKGATIAIECESVTVYLWDDRSCDVSHESESYDKSWYNEDDKMFHLVTAKDVAEAILAHVKSYAKKNTNPSADEKAELDKIRERVGEIDDEINTLMVRKDALRAEANILNKRRRMIEWWR